MSNTSLVLGMNWQLDEWPEYIDVLHTGDCDSVLYVPERTCEIEAGSGYDDLLEEEFWHLSCGHMLVGTKPDFCSKCGAKVVGHETRNMPDKEKTCEGCVIPNRDYGHAPSPCNFCARNDEERLDLYTPAKVVE